MEKTGDRPKVDSKAPGTFNVSRVSLAPPPKHFFLLFAPPKVVFSKKMTSWVFIYVCVGDCVCEDLVVGTAKSGGS